MSRDERPAGGRLHGTQITMEFHTSDARDGHRVRAGLRPRTRDSTRGHQSDHVRQRSDVDARRLLVPGSDGHRVVHWAGDPDRPCTPDVGPQSRRHHDRRSRSRTVRRRNDAATARGSTTGSVDTCAALSGVPHHHERRGSPCRRHRGSRHAGLVDRGRCCAGTDHRGEHVDVDGGERPKHCNDPGESGLARSRGRVQHQSRRTSAHRLSKGNIRTVSGERRVVSGR